MTLDKAERPEVSWGVPQEMHRHSRDGATAQSWTEDLAGSMTGNPEAAISSGSHVSASISKLDSDSDQAQSAETTSSDASQARSETSRATVQQGLGSTSPALQGEEEEDLLELSDSMVRPSASTSATRLTAEKLTEVYTMHPEPLGGCTNMNTSVYGL